MSRWLIAGLACFTLLLAACSGGDGDGGDGGGPGPIAQTNAYKPPLYWDVYEYHIVRQQEASSSEVCGSGENYIPEAELQANVDWVEANLKPFGYDMVAIDGWGDALKLSENGYRASHSSNWEHDYAWWAAHLRSRGMRLGMYENPLVVHVDAADMTTKIVGTDIPVSSLSDPISECTFRWVNVDRPGAEQYVKGYIKYYADMGIDHLRIDFISWFENGFDRYLGQVGPMRPRAHYATALSWMREAADVHGMQLSFAMPHMYNNGELERQYAHSVRISEDVDYGEWWKFSDKDRGTFFYHWPQWANAADGFAFWSPITGRDKVRLDGDFIRMNTFATDAERRSTLSMHLVAGGPIPVADRYDTVGEHLWVYQNKDMLALNADAFVGQPLSSDPRSELSQVWTGRLSNGDTIVGLFNRESTPQTRAVNFADIGVTGAVTVRDLWQHAPLGPMNSLSLELAPHASMVVQISAGASSCTPQSVRLDSTADVQYGNPGPRLSGTATSGLPLKFEVSLGPAQMQGTQAQPTGKSGIVYVIASQPGDDRWCAALPLVGAFAVLGGHQQAMYIGASFTNWAPDISMRLEGDTWTAEGVDIPAGDHEFKFTSAQDWSQQDWGNAQGLSGTVTLTTGGGPNVRISVPEAGRYRVSFNDLTLAYALQRMAPCS